MWVWSLSQERKILLSNTHNDLSDLKFSKAIKWSVGIHIGLILALFIKTHIFFSEPTPYIPALKVDLVALPDILKKDLEKIETLPESETPATPTPSTTVKETKSDEPSVKLTDRKSKMKNALDRIKALQKIEKDNAKPLVKGNKLSPGSSVTGDSKESETRTYYDDLTQHIRRNWSLPIWLERQNLSAQATIYIDAFGRLQGIQLTKPSGNPRFDEEVKRAIELSQPFPKPTEDVANTVQSNGILVGFPL